MTTNVNIANVSHSSPVRIPRRGTITREASLPSDSPQKRRLLLRDSSFQVLSYFAILFIFKYQ